MVSRQYMDVSAFIRQNYKTLSDTEISLALAKKGVKIRAHSVQQRRINLGLRKTAKLFHKSPEELTATYRREKQRDKNIRALSKIEEEKERYQAMLEAVLETKEARKNTFEIKKSKSQGGEATVIAVASDWHIETEIRPETVNQLNEYNLEISKRRAEQFFSTLLRLVEIEQQNTRVDNLILALLGDFITNDIHEEMKETALLRPIPATIRAFEYIASGIDFLLANSKLKILCVCHSGNHARTTFKVQPSTEAGHSLEYFMYHFLCQRYKGNPRISFIIPESYHSFVKVYDMTLCFHHGHNVRYGGGVGGLTVPMNKAIGNWDRARHADIYVNGHFHQVFDGNTFISNGSLIGYDPFAISIKALYEPPAQVMFGIHSKLGKYITRQIKFII